MTTSSDVLVRRCTTCDQDKPQSEFYARRQAEGIFYRASCKQCVREAARRRYRDDPEFRARRRARTKAWNERNPDYMPAYTKAHYEQNRDKRIEQGKAWNRANREKRVAYRRKYEYGITQDEFDAMFAAQGGRCAICGVELTPKNWAIDHDPKSQMVRELLCRPHNVMIGLASEEEAVLMSAIRYIRKWRLQTEA